MNKKSLIFYCHNDLLFSLIVHGIQNPKRQKKSGLTYTPLWFVISSVSCLFQI